MVAITLLALLASAASVSATLNLTLKVFGTSSARGVGALRLTTELVNTGNEALTLLRDPRTILRKIPTNSFTIVNEDTFERPKFIGAQVKYSPAAAVASGLKDGFTILAPGASFSMDHDLSEAYNFTSSGEGRYSIEPGTLFHYITKEKTIVPIYATLDSALATSLTGTLAVDHFVAPSAANKRATFTGCSTASQTTLIAAIKQANTYASSAYSYISGISTGTTRYTTWFGTYSTSRKATVQSHYQKISTSNFDSFTYTCTCTDAGLYAFVYADRFGTINICPGFFKAKLTGTDSQGGTLVHESSHFTAHGGSTDIVYGQSGAKSLAKSNPAQAVMNADSHEYFAENNPSQS